MRACTTATSVAFISLLLASMFSGCAGGQAPDPSSPEGDKSGATSDGTSDKNSDKKDEPKTEAAGSNAEKSADKSATAAPAAAKKGPESVADCKQMLTEITNEPPQGGVVMNNAQSAKDPDSSSRLTPTAEVIKSKRDAFRCCFDLWAKNNPGQGGKVVLQLELAPDGALKTSKVDQDKSDIHAPEVESCMVEVSKSLTYPKSPTGKVTLVSYPFEFKAHR